MAEHGEIPANWYPDPMGRHEFRWWDGHAWTENVASHGRQSIDKKETVKNVAPAMGADKIQKQVAKHDAQSAKHLDAASLSQPPPPTGNQVAPAQPDVPVQPTAPVEPTAAAWDSAPADPGPSDPTLTGSVTPDAIPSDAMPSNAMPSDAMPSNAMPSDAMRSNAMPSDAMPPAPTGEPMPPPPTGQPVAPSDSIQPAASPDAFQPPGPGAPVGPTSSIPLLDRQLLVINQKVKLIEVNTEFSIYDENGAAIGSVRQVGQSNLKKAVRFLGSVDQFLTHKYQLVDADGSVLLGLTRPAKFVKSRVVVNDAVGATVGEIAQQNVFGKIRFGFFADGVEIGGIFAENWRAWNFSIKDAAGTEVARVTKTFEGILKTAFTTADNYVLQIHQPLTDPLRHMVIASAVTIDTALKQDARGLNAGSLLDF